MAGLGTRTLVITVGGTDYTAQISKTVITANPADNDFVTFADAANGGAREYRLEFTAVQDLVAGTIWDKVFASAGTTAPFILKPYGNAAASTTQPHFTGNAIISEPDGDVIGGEADASATARMTFEASGVLTAKPVRVTA